MNNLMERRDAGVKDELVRRFREADDCLSVGTCGLCQLPKSAKTECGENSTGYTSPCEKRGLSKHAFDCPEFPEAVARPCVGAAGPEKNRGGAR